MVYGEGRMACGVWRMAFLCSLCSVPSAFAIAVALVHVSALALPVAFVLLLGSLFSVLCFLFHVAFAIASALVHDLALALPENRE